MNVHERTYPQSAELFRSAQLLIPGGVTSSVRAGVAPHPLYFERGAGPYLWDVDGNQYLDFVLAYGPPILGYAPAVLNAALAAQLERGLTFGSQHRAEQEVAELLTATVPGAEQAIFSGSGSEAVAVALRIARTVTGRSKVVKFEGHYHGWLDGVFAGGGYDPARSGPGARPNTVPNTLGIAPGALTDLIIAPWNDAAAVEAIFDQDGSDIAALILEPLNVNGGVIPPRPGFLDQLRDITRRHGSLLIFDEVITGFRLALGGAQEYYGVQADLAIFAKALAGGIPMSAVTGSRDLFDPIAKRRMAHNGTFNAYPLACAAAKATLGHLMEHREPIYGQFRELGDQLARGLAAASGAVTVRAAGPIVSIWFGEPENVQNIRDRTGSDLAASSDLAVKLLARGIHARSIWYLSTAHEQRHVLLALEAVGEILSA